MEIAVPRERAPGERRVAMVPEVAVRLIGAGHRVRIEHDAGDSALFSDAQYLERSVDVMSSESELFSSADVVCKVLPPSIEEVSLLREGSAVLSFFQPGADHELVAALVARRITSFSLDLLPRISRVQSMDVLSSQSTVSGYRSVLVAADRFTRFFPMFMTAAGTVPPAKVLILGAGVAGLQAIATARRLGAQVRAYDVRPASREEVQSLGAKFVELEIDTQQGTGGYAAEQSEETLKRQRELIAKEVAGADIVITTAAIPGRQAPLLVTTEMVDAMARGSVIVDLAAESGGNCELSAPGLEIDHHGVVVYGAQNLTSTMATHASFLYSRNIAEFVGLLSKEGEFLPDFDDEIIAATCVTHNGEIRHGPTQELIGGSAK